MSWSRVWIGRIIAVCAVGAAIWTASVVLDRMDREVWTHEARPFADTLVRRWMSVGESWRCASRTTRGSPGRYTGRDRPRPSISSCAGRALRWSLQAQIDLTTRQVAVQATGADAAATQIARARAQLGYAQDTVSRLTPLLDKGHVTVQQVDEAQRTRRSRKPE